MRRLRRLGQKRSLRWTEGVCVLEGPDLIDAALDAGAEFEGIYLDATRESPALRVLCEKAEALGVRVFHLGAGVIEKISDAQTPQPILAAVRFVPRGLSDISPRGCVVVLHDLRDPGNAGTVIRTADAAGASAVIFTGQSVDPYNPKTLRATAGSIFHVPLVLHESLRAVTTWFHEAGGTSVAAVVRGGVDHYDAPLGGDVMIVMGNESEGLSPDDVRSCSFSVSIAMSGDNESLNVAMATGLLLFESRRQRLSGGPGPTP